MPEEMSNTLLNPMALAEVNGPIHRDYLAHCLRWAYVGRLIGLNETIVDVGAGIGNLEETLWRNRFAPIHLYAVEVHPPFLKKLEELATKVNYDMKVLPVDIRKESIPIPDNTADTVTCFEMVEHFEKKYLAHALQELSRVVKSEGRVLLSTPNYDGKNQADNHIHEYTEEELREELEKEFEVVRQFGTFMSPGQPSKAQMMLSKTDYDTFMRLRQYYNSTFLSIIFAPLYPHQSRNILWVLRKKTRLAKVAHLMAEAEAHLENLERIDTNPA